MKADVLLNATFSEYHFKVPEHAFLHWVTDMKYKRPDSQKQRNTKARLEVYRGTLSRRLASRPGSARFCTEF